MKYIIVVFLFFNLVTVHAQNFILPEGEFMDTTNTINPKCESYNVYYYQINGKYPKSSPTLLKEAQQFLQNKNKIYTGSGYITFRSRINCEGKLNSKKQVLQTDEKYKTTHFDKELVTDLFNYFKTLDKWEVPKTTEEQAFSYTTFITFKINNGKIINIIP